MEGKWFSCEELQATVNEKLEQVFAEIKGMLLRGGRGSEGLIAALEALKAKYLEQQEGVKP